MSIIFCNFAGRKVRGNMLIDNKFHVEHRAERVKFK